MATFRSISGTIPGLIADILRRNHTLIAGTSGSGKSTLIVSIIHNAILKSPGEVALILIDPKRVDLVRYADLPHTLRHAVTVDESLQALRDAREIIEKRYTQMARNRQHLYNGSDIYIIIDELADLMTTARRDVVPLIQSIGQIGRAARVHLICATQCPLAKIIPTEIKVNFDGIIGLRTRSAQDSRNILGISGCEDLPIYGTCWYDSPRLTEITQFAVPFYPDDEIDDRIAYWERQTPHKWFGRKWIPAVC